MDLGLKNKVALVLASSKGLGKSVALDLAKEGAKVVICSRNTTELEQAKQDIERQTSSSVLAITCDLLDTNQRADLVKQVEEQLGTIDLLVTNIGGPKAGGFESHDAEDWKHLFNAIFLSVVDIITLVIPKMKAQGFGRILTITSISSKQPVDNLISSNAMRAALLGLVKSISNEYAPFGITVNNILPGFTTTERLKDLMEQSPNQKQAIDTIPMKRFGRPEEFSAVATFLLSERASYVTGVSIPVDGGWIKGI